MTMRPFEKCAIIVSIPMDRCVKNFLDTPIYSALKQRYPLVIISYLSDQQDFRQTYGGDNVQFYPKPEIQGSWRRRMYNLCEIFRFFGYHFRWRKSVTKVHWTGLTKYKYPQDYKPQKSYEPRTWRYLALLFLSFLGSTFGLHRLIIRCWGNWMYANRDLDRFFQEQRPKVYIATANRTEQEKMLAHYARKYCLASILVPDSWDNFVVDGFLFHQFDRFCLMGPRQLEQIKILHDVPEERLVHLGVPVHRMYENLIRTNRSYSLRERFQIPSDTNIISFLAVSKKACFDTLDIVDHLLERIEDGTISNAVLLLRTQPGEDPSEVLARYRGRTGIRIQVGGNKGGGGESCIEFKNNEESIEYIETIREASVVITGISGCVIDACMLDVPVIANLIQLSAYPPGGFSPQALALADSLGIMGMGCPRAYSLDELVDMIKEYLKNPGKDRSIRQYLFDEWDYQNPLYIENFLKLVEREIP